MMKKFLLIFVAILSLALSCALAEEAYVPGSVTKDLFLDAYERGEMVLLDAQWDVTPAENAEAILGEDAASLPAVSEMLKNTKLTIGSGKIENGVRILLEGDYAANEERANLSVTLDLTYDGVAIASSAIPGECLTAKWETLLALCELTEEEIASVLSLRDADFDTLLTELAAQIAPVLDLVVQIAAPYGETILAHIAALPMQINENVPAENGYPAAAVESYVQISAKAIGDLVIALCEQVKQDETLCAILDAVLANAEATDGPAPTTAQLCDAIAQAAAQEMTDETTPLHLYIGMDENGNLLYINISIEIEEDAFFVINYINGQLEESSASLINVDVLTMNAEQEIIDGLSFVTAYDMDESNPQVLSFEATLSAYAEGAEIAGLSVSASNEPASFGEGPAYAGVCNFNFNMQDGESVVSVAFETTSTATALLDGGEEIAVTGTMNIAADGEQIPMVLDGYIRTEITEEGIVSTMTEGAQLPEYGIADAREIYTLYTAPKSTDALTETALETASAEELEALAGRAMTALEQESAKLLELLPPELTAELSADDAAIAVIE